MELRWSWGWGGQAQILWLPTGTHRIFTGYHKEQKSARITFSFKKPAQIFHLVTQRSTTLKKTGQINRNVLMAFSQSLFFWIKKHKWPARNFAVYLFALFSQFLGGRFVFHTAPPPVSPRFLHWISGRALPYTCNPLKILGLFPT